jgi:potassium uptake TrkH family protein
MRSWWRHPARIIPVAFLCLIAFGTVMLMLPISRKGEGQIAPFFTAFFTSVSTSCITGLSVVDPATYWSPFGHIVLLVLIQIGGFGIMALASLLGLFAMRRLGLTGRLATQHETHAVGLGDVRGLLLRVGLFTIIFEAVTTVILAGRFWLGYDYPFGKAVWLGFFHAVSGFNNAGIALFSDNLMGFTTDWWICFPLILAIISGGLGFPVIYELLREAGQPSRWSTHTRITVFGSIFLLVTGFVVVLTFEWGNPGTFGPLDAPGKILAAMFQGTVPRTAGFNTVDYAQMESETRLFTNWLMFIGGGSAGTSGGIKVTTFFLLAFVILAEIRSERDVVIGKRRIAEAAQRQALTVALLGVAIVAFGTFALLFITHAPLDQVFFEATAAFSTAGLSTGLTATLPVSGQIVLIILMYVGRVGTVTVAAALALSERRALYRYAEERPIVG